MIEKSNLYGDLRDAAHQKPSSFCSHRAIIRNKSYWIESDEALELFPGKDVDNVRSIITQEFDQEKSILDDLWTNLVEVYDASKIITTSAGNRFVKKGKVCVLAGYDADDFYNRVIISRHFNRVSVKHIVDWRYYSRSLDVRNPKESSELAKRFNAIRKFNSNYSTMLLEMNPARDDTTNIFEEMYSHAIAQNGGVDIGRDRFRYERLEQEFWTKDRFIALKSHLDFLYEGYWETVEEKLEEAVLNDSQGNARKKPLEFCSAIKQFADFRGLVWPAHNSITSHIEGRLEDHDPTDDARLLRLNWALIKGSEYQESEEGDNYKASRYFSARDLIACSIGQTANGSKDNNVGIYVSTLGQQNYTAKEEKGHNREAPIRYTLLAKTKNYRQIGRAIDKIDLLGVYRLVALRDFQKVLNAGRELQIIDETISRSSGTDRLSPARAEKFSIMLNRVGEDIEGGLLFRVATSKHYVKSLRRLIETANFQKIPGFEAYDEFVERKLFRVYDNIARVGERWKKLQLRRRTLLSEIQIASIAKSSEQSMMLATVASSIEIVAVTYYFGSMLLYPVGWLSSVWDFSFDDGGKFLVYLVVGVLYAKILRGIIHDRVLIGFRKSK